jgi:hypothetical protein
MMHIETLTAGNGERLRLKIMAKDEGWHSVSLIFPLNLSPLSLVLIVRKTGTLLVRVMLQVGKY